MEFDPVSVGWLSIIPPIIAIGLALITKEVISSLILGIISGTFIYSIALGENVILGTITYAFKIIEARVDIGLIVVMAMLGAIVEVISRSGGQYAMANWTKSHFKSRTTSELATVIVGSCLFLSDVFHNLSAGAVMKTINDSNRVSRAKFAYLLDATAAPVCCLVPMGIWVAGICSCFPETNAFGSPMEIFFANIPYNIYCIISIIMVIYFCFPNRDLGKMRIYEMRAEKTGELGGIETETKEAGNGKISDMAVPILVLVLASMLFMLYTGGLFSGEGVTITDAFANCSTSTSLQSGAFVALLVAFCMYVPRKIVSFKDFISGIYEGIKSMVPGITIIVLAWGIGGVCRKMLMTGDFVANVVIKSNMPVGVLPAIIFIIAAALSFATGTSWGTFGILMPIVFNICEIAAPELLLPAIAAVLGGSCWGDHCSPISDTTVLASMCSGSDHIEHVSTQLPYGITGGVCAVIGYLVAGFTGGSVVATWITALIVLVVMIFLLTKHTNKMVQTAIDSGEI
ncbi:MAG: Na+/H+ antiporter NhaC family protein [Mogibacterium sp.]|nr:Na+/H+ antiporter NhaC family protein [Mogibacterium sp.]